MVHKRRGRAAKERRRQSALARPRIAVIIPVDWRERWDAYRPGCLVVAAEYIAGQEVGLG